MIIRLQAQRVADRDGRSSRGLRSDCAKTVVRARGQFRISQKVGRVPASTGRGRPKIQRVFSVERHRRVLRHQVLLPAVRNATR